MSKTLFHKLQILLENKDIETGNFEKLSINSEAMRDLSKNYKYSTSYRKKLTQDWLLQA